MLKFHLFPLVCAAATALGCAAPAPDGDEDPGRDEGAGTDGDFADSDEEAVAEAEDALLSDHTVIRASNGKCWTAVDKDTLELTNCVHSPDVPLAKKRWILEDNCLIRSVQFANRCVHMSALPHPLRLEVCDAWEPRQQFCNVPPEDGSGKICNSDLSNHRCTTHNGTKVLRSRAAAAPDWDREDF